MPEKNNIPDQDDVLATNERLTADNTRLTGELKAANELLETAQADLNTATQRRPIGWTCRDAGDGDESGGRRSSPDSRPRTPP